ncbi:hypothetical protein QAD02_000218 [Eretmocerus hayati]|uniref:Uncharacterized protein n=1 Tax=Eretmocerus hayati TaxID=131215 RepID=A0ACC2NF43_9HYME|nr:hypothetical protein QAD02_000218 [Eretmocerus hayati]
MSDEEETFQLEKQVLTDALFLSLKILKDTDLVNDAPSDKPLPQSEYLAYEISLAVIKIVKDAARVEDEELFLFEENLGELEASSEPCSGGADACAPSESPLELTESETTTAEESSPSIWELSQEYSNEYISLDYKIKVVNMKREHPNWSLESIRANGGGKLSRMDELTRWKKEIAKGGTFIDKSLVIDKWTYDRFKECRERGKPVFTRDLRVWALQAARQFESSGHKFTASKSWIGEFKQKHRIRMRKITRYVKPTEYNNEATMMENNQNFRTNCSEKMKNFKIAINTDQTGCEYRVDVARSLAPRGSKAVNAYIGDLNRMWIASIFSRSCVPLMTPECKAMVSTGLNHHVYLIDRYQKDQNNCLSLFLLRASRESYGDAAIGYVCLKRNQRMVCTVKARMTPEHKKNDTPYSVAVVIDEKVEKIVNVSCDGCATGQGGCKHAFAFLMWLNRRSEEPACTEVKCYWKKSILSGAGTKIPFILAADMVKKKKPVDDNLPDNSTFLQDVISQLGKNQCDTVLSRYTICLIDRKVHNLSIHQMLTLYISQDNHPSADGFIEFGKKIMDTILCQELEEQTRNQSEDLLWEAVRYARVTASKLDEVAHCKTPEGSLCKQIIGVSKVHDTKYMKRGRILEQRIFDELYRKGYKVSKCGIFILPAYPILGGSPDGISDDYILEIKCPASESTFKNYLHNGNITPKYKAQMMLQMFVARKRKDISKYSKVHAYLKKLTKKHEPKRSRVLSAEQVYKFIDSAPEPRYLLHKVVLALGLSGCCRMHELIELLMNQVIILDDCMIVTIPKNKTKNAEEKIFRVVGSFFELVQRYLAARASIDHDRFLMSYRTSCGFINVPAGKATIRTVPTVVAEFLQLPCAHEYTGHCVRRSAATIYASTGVTNIDLMQFGKWKTLNSAQIYNVDTDFNRNKVAHIVTNAIMSEPISDRSNTTARKSSFPRPATTPSKPKITNVTNLHRGDVRYVRAAKIHPMKRNVTSTVTSENKDEAQESAVTSHDQSDSLLLDVSSSTLNNSVNTDETQSVPVPTVPICNGLHALRAGKYQYTPYEAIPLVPNKETAVTPGGPTEKQAVVGSDSSVVNKCTAPLPSWSGKSVITKSVTSSKLHVKEDNRSGEVPHKGSRASELLRKLNYHGTIYNRMSPSPPELKNSSFVPRDIPVSYKIPLRQRSDPYEESVIHDVDDSYNLADVSAGLFDDFCCEPTTSNDQQASCTVEHQFEAILNETDEEEEFDSQGATMDNNSVVQSLSERCSNYTQEPMRILEESKDEVQVIEPEPSLRRSNHEVGDESNIPNAISPHNHWSGSRSSERIDSDDESVPDGEWGLRSYIKSCTEFKIYFK